MLKQIRFMY